MSQSSDLLILYINCLQPNATPGGSNRCSGTKMATTASCAAAGNLLRDRRLLSFSPRESPRPCNGASQVCASYFAGQTREHLYWTHLYLQSDTEARLWQNRAPLVPHTACSSSFSILPTPHLSLAPKILPVGAVRSWDDPLVAPDPYVHQAWPTQMYPTSLDLT